MSTKFIVEGIYEPDSSNFGIFFIPDVNGTLLGDVNITFASAGIVTESDLRAAQENAIVTWANGIGGYTGVTAADIVMPEKPLLATVATSGVYSDLTGKPTIPTVQAYDGTTQRLGAFPIYKDVTVSSGTAVFYLTNDNTSTGTALFSNGVIADSVNVTVSDAAASYQMSWAFSNSNKTLTVTTNKLTTANILTGILGQNPANGAVVKLSVWGY